MKIFFAEKDPDKIMANLEEAMGKRALSKIVSFSLSGDTLTVKLSKLGTSTLEFHREVKEDGSEFVKTKEKIALSHKPLKGEVTEKIMKVIKKAGGKIDE